MRLTYKKLVQLVNDAFKRVGKDDLEAFDAYNPRFNSDQLARGAAQIIVKVKTKGGSDYSVFSMYCFSWNRLQLEEEINKGAVIGFYTVRRYGIENWSDAEIKPIYIK